jgi:hypothetical protein
VADLTEIGLVLSEMHCNEKLTDKIPLVCVHVTCILQLTSSRQHKATNMLSLLRNVCLYFIQDSGLIFEGDQRAATSQ